MSEHIAFTALIASDREPIARLLHRALVHWYESRLGQGSRFGDSHEPFTLFPDVYEALDPGECVTARTASGEIVGVCFSHERETHVSVGIVATSPDAGGRGIAKRMMSLVLDKAKRLGKPVRLVSSLLNLDSFSLYTRLGFVPGAMFQDLLITIPETGLAATAPAGIERVRDAVLADAPRISDFEHAQQGIRREKDFAFFIRNEVGAWRVLVSEASDGSVNGFLAMSTHPSFTMIGPGVAIDETTAVALLWRALGCLRGQTLVFLASCAASTLVRTAYSWGARNVELHVAQSTAPVAGAKGIVFPTFMPETA
ncbi:MAG: GNAT family N-acetyltransferase [Prosthecobacter sp.]|uniref:GNAT family N-acetyltransferase n=1 Tax=Prosthecobacter sp. TaxID=1965333 RepID=UPI0025CE94AA|nr:GNAT family N-acetyltransferase [Prosthecobacter sp.]MCF7787106.1 GNAT family N-acetyltransferase [Prosthecobacter sp.]